MCDFVQDGVVRFETVSAHSLALVVLHGTVMVNGTVTVNGTVMVNGTEIGRGGQLVQFGNEGATVGVEANNDATLLVLSGEPFDEPVVGHGPFVMSSKREILEAFEDFMSGRFGLIPA